MDDEVKKVSRPAPPARLEQADLQSLAIQKALHGTFDPILSVPIPEPLLKLLVGVNRADEQKG
jgi:hypothetical protein